MVFLWFSYDLHVPNSLHYGNRSQPAQPLWRFSGLLMVSYLGRSAPPWRRWDSLAIATRPTQLTHPNLLTHTRIYIYICLYTYTYTYILSAHVYIYLYYLFVYLFIDSFMYLFTHHISYTYSYIKSHSSQFINVFTFNSPKFH